MPKGKGLEDFVAEHGPRDIRKRVEAGLKELGDSWETNADFGRRCGLAYAELPKARELFPEHVLLTRNKSNDPQFVWAGTKQFMAKLREIAKRGRQAR